MCLSVKIITWTYLQTCITSMRRKLFPMKRTCSWGSENIILTKHTIHVIVSNAEQRWNKGLICKHCGKCVAIEGENHLWVGIEEILGSQVCAFVLYLIPEESSNIGDTFFTGPGRMERSCVSSWQMVTNYPQQCCVLFEWSSWPNPEWIRLLSSLWRW